jgi:hypothetical protein
MDVGKPVRVIEVEPLVSPVPPEKPERPTEKPPAPAPSK